jgi:hypothetical protein
MGGMENVVGVLADERTLDQALKAAEASHSIVMFQGGEHSSDAVGACGRATS